jgi:crossover junction endodeoxyribonuclease RusA
MTSPDTGRAGEVRVELPWFDKILSPNARVHWMRKAKVTKAARLMGWGYVLAATGGKPNIKGAAHVSMTFCPPDKRRRDLDNCISSTKAHRDGIADAIGIDDSKFQTTYAFGEPVKGGAVIVTIRGIE